MKPTKEMLEAFSILIVDDDAMVRTVICEYLVSYGFVRVEEAKNGKKALKMLQSEGKRYDMIISDWEMPEMDGLTFLKAIRNDPGQAMTKFIMVTSQSSQERFKISRAAKSSVDAYVMKPFRGEILKKKIYEVMGWSLDTGQAA